MSEHATTSRDPDAVGSLGAAEIGPCVRTPMVTLRSTATLRSASRIMVLQDTAAIAIVDEGLPIGVLSQHDITRALAAGADPDIATVAAWMMKPPVWAHPTDHIAPTAITMLRNRLPSLPVLGADAERIGAVQLDEILLPLLHAEELPGEHLPYMPPD